MLDFDQAATSPGLPMPDADFDADDRLHLLWLALIAVAPPVPPAPSDDTTRRAFLNTSGGFATLWPGKPAVLR